MIRVNNLVKHFGTRAAVGGVSFEVDKGTVLGFLGPNGAGKTTTMRMITGYLPPTAGTAEVEGYDIQEQPLEVRRRIGYLPESAPMYGEMLVEDFLRFVAEMRGYTKGERDRRVDEVIERTFLGQVRSQSIDTLSKGYRQRTAFAQAILHDPPVLIMDEPTEGLDPNQKQVVRTMIRQMATDKAIILSTHVLEEVEAICSRVVIISDGKLVADSTPTELKQRSAQHQAVYLELAPGPEPEPDALQTLEGVRRVQRLDPAGDGGARLRIFPVPGAAILEPVLGRVREKAWTARDLRVEEGRLDEVFRQLTVSEDVKHEPAKEEA